MEIKIKAGFYNFVYTYFSKVDFILFIAFLFISINSNSQCLLLGNDFSYVNTIEENGGIYHDGNNTEIDPFEYFAQRGAGIARMRLWHSPENIIDFCGNPISANNLGDVITAFKRAKNAGMQLKLAIHYGDYFNDPSTQKMPAAWQGLSHEILIDSIYNYTYAVLEKLNAENVLPDIVAIGNETTWGFIDANQTTDGWEWPQDADKFNAGLDAVDAFNSAQNSSIKKAVHFTDKTAAWLAGLFHENGVTNFDIIGISFYPKWTEFNSVEEFGQLISSLIFLYGKEVMVFEAGGPWTTASGDNYNNIINDYGNLNYPISKQGQKDFLLDLAQTVYDNGGTGIIYWEAAYISSEMCTKWGQGSPYENVSFFDFNNGNTPLPAFDFFDFCNSVNMEETSQAIELTVFPNPTDSNEINITSSLPLASWQLLSLKGQVLEKGDFSGNNKNYLITISQKDPSLYFIKIKTTEGQVISKKILTGN